MFKRIISLSAAVAVVLAIASNAWAEQTWTVNFKDSEIQEVIKFVADVTGKTVVIDQRVKGRVKVISSKPLNEAQLIDLFRTILEVHDYTLVEVNDMLRIVPLKDARSSPVPVTDDRTDEKGFITQVIQLQNIAAAKVLPVIRPLVPQHSHLAAYDPANAIIISDSVENIARIRDLIERIDKSATPVTDIIDLKYASADDLVQTLTKLDKPENNRRSQADSLQIIADKRNNAVLVTGEDLQRKRIKQLIRRLDRPKPQTGNVRVIYLDYAKAKETAEVLTKVVANLSKITPGGEGQKGQAGATVEADEGINALLITAEGDTLNTLLEVVSRLDIRRAQVLVEAIIVEMEDGLNKDFGIDVLFEDIENGAYGASNNQGGGGSIAQAAFGRAAAYADDPDSAESLTALGNLATNLAGAPGQVLGVIGTNEDVNFNVILQALESNSKSNILSTPSLLTMDNNEASFTVGKNVPFVTGSFTNTGTGNSSPFQTIQREDVGITLKVTPHVNEGDKVLLDIAQEISSVSDDASAASDIITNQRKIETQILTADGEVVVMGGFISEDMRISEKRVPILGKLPLLGKLFRSEGKSTAKTNLMIFIRATVLRDDEALTGATAEKYQYIREQQMNQMDNGLLRFKEKDLPLLPDMTEYNLSPTVTPATSSENDDAP